MGRRDAIEAVKFLAAMAGLAGAFFAVGWLLIQLGGWALKAAHWLFRSTGLPPAASLSLAVLAVVFAVIVIERRLTRARKPRLDA